LFAPKLAHRGAIPGDVAPVSELGSEQWTQAGAGDNPDVAALRAELAGWRAEATRRWAEAVGTSLATTARERAADERYHREVGELHDLIDELRGSTSWRVTKPLRAFSAVTGRLRRRP
jgi:hypothetical protein